MIKPKEYVKFTKSLMGCIDFDILENIINVLKNQDKCVFIAGNGGSAATANHFAEDMEYGSGRGNVVSLVDNISIITAIANDKSYDDIFLNQLRCNFKPEDIFFAISCSGNSSNIVKAAIYASSIGTVISLVGFDGGKLKEISDYCIHVPLFITNKERWMYAPLEDVHTMLCHIIAVRLYNG
jgi:D-sedoheptulose 7-phosphate isomerase